MLSFLAPEAERSLAARHFASSSTNYARATAGASSLSYHLSADSADIERRHLPGQPCRRRHARHCSCPPCSSSPCHRPPVHQRCRHFMPLFNVAIHVTSQPCSCRRCRSKTLCLPCTIAACRPPCRRQPPVHFSHHVQRRKCKSVVM